MPLSYVSPPKKKRVEPKNRLSIEALGIQE